MHPGRDAERRESAAADALAHAVALRRDDLELARTLLRVLGANMDRLGIGPASEDVPPGILPEGSSTHRGDPV